MGSIILCRIDVPDSAATEEEIDKYLDVKERRIRRRLENALDEDFVIVSLPSSVNLEILSASDLLKKGLRVLGYNGDNLYDQHGNAVPNEVIELLKARKINLYDGNLRKCAELRDEIRMMGYEINNDESTVLKK